METPQQIATFYINADTPDGEDRSLIVGAASPEAAIGHWVTYYDLTDGDLEDLEDPSDFLFVDVMRVHEIPALGDGEHVNWGTPVLEGDDAKNVAVAIAVLLIGEPS